jgi:hypothetical protein
MVQVVAVVRVEAAHRVLQPTVVTVVEDFEAEKFIEEEVQILEGVPEPMDEFEDLDAPKSESKSESKPESKPEPEKEEELQMEFEELA